MDTNALFNMAVSMSKAQAPIPSLETLLEQLPDNYALSSFTINNKREWSVCEIVELQHDDMAVHLNAFWLGNTPLDALLAFYNGDKQ